MDGLLGRWHRALAGVTDVDLRIAYLRSELVARNASELFAALEDMAASAERGDADLDLGLDRVLGAMAPLLADPDLAPRWSELKALAEKQPLAALARWLHEVRGRPGEDGSTSEATAKVPTAPGGRTLTLGERRALARNPSRAAFEQLLADPHPMVVRNLLGNPRLTEDQALRIASRRPGRREILAEVARNPRWVVRPRIRLALIENPDTAAEVALALLPRVTRPVLEILAREAASPAVRSAAADLLTRPERASRALPAAIEVEDVDGEAEPPADDGPDAGG